MAILMTLWSKLLGNKQAELPQKASAKSYPPEKKAPAPASPKANLLEKRKLLSTRVTSETKAYDRLDLDHLRARINERSPAYLERRQRQQQSKARWFGQAASTFNEEAISKRLFAPVRMTEVVAVEEPDLSCMNFADINLDSYYDNQLMDAAEADGGFELSGENFSEAPPLVALDDDIPELEELLARLQIIERVEMLEMESEKESECRNGNQDGLVQLHLVAPISLVESDFAAPVELSKHRRKGGKGKKSRRARQKDTVRA